MEHELPVAGGILIVALRELFFFLKTQRDKDVHSKLERLELSMEKLRDRINDLCNSKDTDLENIREDMVSMRININRILDREDRNAKK